MKKGNLLYIHIPRTAGTHFEKAFGFRGHDKPPRCGSPEYGANYEEIMGWDSKTKLMLQHATYNQLIEHDFISADNDLIKFTIIRNPYDRAVSLYKYFGGEKKWENLETFLLHVENDGINGYFYMPQYKYLIYNNNIDFFNIIKFEDYLSDISAFKDKVNVEFDITFNSQRQISKSKENFNTYYKTQKIIEKVNNLYKKDFELLGYDML